MTKTAVLIHGLHLGSNLRQFLWRDLVIGDISNGTATGRATYGVLLAWRERADKVIFSTGASERYGLKEAAYTYQAILQVSDLLAAALGITEQSFRQWLVARVRLDLESQTTPEELARNLTWCHDEDHHRVILVTNRFHVPRALAIANSTREGLGLHPLTIFACAPNDVSSAPAIFEPSTRPDRPGLDWHGLLPEIFQLPAERQAAAFTEISAILMKR